MAVAPAPRAQMLPLYPDTYQLETWLLIASYAVVCGPLKSGQQRFYRLLRVQPPPPNRPQTKKNPPPSELPCDRAYQINYNHFLNNFFLHCLSPIFHKRGTSKSTWVGILNFQFAVLAVKFGHGGRGHIILILTLTVEGFVHF